MVLLHTFFSFQSKALDPSSGLALMILVLVLVLSEGHVTKWDVSLSGARETRLEISWKLAKQ